MYEENTFEDFEDEYGSYDALQMFEYCAVPTVTQAFDFVYELILFNVLFFIINRALVREHEFKYHLNSSVLGFSYIYLRGFIYSIEAFFIIPLVYISYIFLYLNRNRANVPFTLGALFISILISFEFFYTNHEAWLKIRGIAMVAMMKIMSLTFDYKKSRKFPSLLEYSGYMWCPATTVLGPWISYKEYLTGRSMKLKITLYWVYSVIYYLFWSTVFLIFSNCVNAYLIPDSFDMFLISYREAASFRMSHYFVSYLSSAGMVAGGFTSDSKNNKWAYKITDPLDVEFPRSLVNVVINWNIPTHIFLKKYIFPNFLPYGQFVAVLMTYLVSSMLHGLSIEVSVVLLSLGFFSYGQYKFQEVFSSMINACVKVRPCKSRCDHKYKANSLLTICCNRIFSISTIIYLAYIGCLMETISSTSSAVDILWDILYKWQDLHYIGHIMFVTCFVLTFCLKKFM